MPRKVFKLKSICSAKFHASTRPRHYASENIITFARAIGVVASFNEAEALRLGKLYRGMYLKHWPTCFNEAEALRLGKPDIVGCDFNGGQGFNEAEALRLGKPSRSTLFAAN